MHQRIAMTSLPMATLNSRAKSSCARKPSRRENASYPYLNGGDSFR